MASVQTQNNPKSSTGDDESTKPHIVIIGAG
jgi:hypothetical protein